MHESVKHLPIAENESASLPPDLRRMAGVVGLLLLVLVFTYEVIGPSLIAGGPYPSGSRDPRLIGAYYAHAGLGPLSLVAFMTVPLFVLFFFALRERLSDNARVRFWSTLGLMFAVAEVPLILGGGALQAAMVTIVATGGNPFSLFVFWDLFWNGAAYVLEASFVFAFAIAMASGGTFPRWLPWMSYAVAALLGVNVLVVPMRLPSSVALPANLLYAAWFVAVSVHQLRVPVSYAGRDPAPA